MKTIRILVLGMPPGGYAIRRTHYMQTRRESQSLKADAYYLAKAEAAKQDVREPFQKATLAVQFRWADRRRHDLDNAVAGLKPIIDGLVGVLVVDDDVTHLRFGDINGVLGCPQEGILLTVTEGF